MRETNHSRRIHTVFRLFGILVGLGFIYLFYTLFEKYAHWLILGVAALCISNTIDIHFFDPHNDKEFWASAVISVILLVAGSVMLLGFAVPSRLIGAVVQASAGILILLTGKLGVRLYGLLKQ